MLLSFHRNRVKLIEILNCKRSLLYMLVDDNSFTIWMNPGIIQVFYIYILVCRYFLISYALLFLECILIVIIIFLYSRNIYFEHTSKYIITLDFTWVSDVYILCMCVHVYVLKEKKKLFAFWLLIFVLKKLVQHSPYNINIYWSVGNIDGVKITFRKKSISKNLQYSWHLMNFDLKNFENKN